MIFITYPTPTHRESITIGQLEVGGGRIDRDPQLFQGAREGIYTFLGRNTYMFHGSTEGPRDTYKKNSFLTSEGIIIYVRGNETNDLNPKPLDLTVELYSFTTPVDDLARELTEIARQGARKALPPVRRR